MSSADPTPPPPNPLPDPAAPTEPVPLPEPNPAPPPTPEPGPQVEAVSSAASPTPGSLPEEATVPPAPETPPVTAEQSGEVSAETPASAPPPVDLEQATATPPPPPPRPAQPVPPVPPAPQPHDLSRLAQDLQVRKTQVEAVVQLLDAGNTVPFITYYRRERTGGLDEVQVRRIRDRITHLRDLAARKQTVLRSIANQGRLTDDLTQAILAADTPRRLDDLYLPFKPKKKSLAAEARERGLEPLALAIWSRDPAVERLDEVLPGMVDPWKQLHDVQDVLTGVRSILAELIAESAEVRGPVRAFAWDTAQLVTTKVETLPEGKGQEYRDYFQFREPVRVMPPHRVLAVNRGERENIIRVRLDWDAQKVREIVLSRLPLEDHPHREVLLPALDEAVVRVLMPSLEKEVRRELTEVAQDHAVDIFARNLRSLLMRRPLGRVRVLAIDPGARHGCRLVVLDELGQPLEDALIHPHAPQKRTAEARLRLEQLIRKYQTPVIAIGSGTACRETEQLVADLIAEFENRRLNPPPPPSPIEAVTASTAAPEAETPPAEMVPTAPTEAVATTTAPILPGLAETTMVHTGLGVGETAVVSAAEPGSPAAESAVVQSPPVESVPPPPPAPVIHLDGLPEPPIDLAYVIVNEAGASDYASSPPAKEEFPTLDPSARAAISIGRRLQDPLAELVKIDPQHVGVGLYQHDVRAKYLKESVEAVIESCVNAVGVDVNAASVPLLRHVSGLNQLVAREIVEYRRTHGPLPTRETLRTVPQVTEQRFTQAAGFLRVWEGSEPLDLTWVHPESYPLARQVLSELGFAPEDLRDAERLRALRERLGATNPEELAAKHNVAPGTIVDLFDAVAQPGRDPREDRPPPILRKAVLKLEDLKPGMELRGEVLNVVDFGAFVDVGLKDSGLVHISQMANRYIKSPYDVIAVGDVVPVWVIGVDPDRRRVSLSMIPPGQERRPAARGGERPPRGERPPAPPRAERPPMPARPAAPAQGGPPRQGAGPRQGGPGPRPRGPGVPGWRSGPKPQGPAPQQQPVPAGEGAPPSPPPPPGKKPPRQRAAPKLSDTQKLGKEPVYSFAQLAALLKAKDQPPAESPPPPPPGGTEAKPEAPPAG